MLARNASATPTKMRSTTGTRPLRGVVPAPRTYNHTAPAARAKDTIDATKPSFQTTADNTIATGIAATAKSRPRPTFSVAANEFVGLRWLGSPTPCGAGRAGSLGTGV